jgi:hypothetical protein
MGRSLIAAALRATLLATTGLLPADIDAVVWHIEHSDPRRLGMLWLIRHRDRSDRAHWAVYDEQVDGPAPFASEGENDVGVDCALNLGNASARLSKQLDRQREATARAWLDAAEGMGSVH